MSASRCRHCRRLLTPADRQDEAGELPHGHLCGECADLAVWASPCDACDHIPGRLEGCPPAACRCVTCAPAWTTP